MPPELDTLLDRFDGRPAPDSIEAERLHLAVRARLLDEEVPETRIDRYVVRARLGAGGMGVVYAAHDAELDREVAIKLVRSSAGVDRSADQQRLLREAQSLAQLSHPNVVSIYAVGLHRERVFIAMELVRGKTLRAHVVAGVTPWTEIVAAYLQAGEGLAAAHAAGWVHRDFKPDNALVGTDGRVRVLDFGLAQAHGMLLASEPGLTSTTAMSPVLTATGQVVGTPAYMSPEQFAGAPADARSDQFSFCVALWEALFGERPFAGGTADELRMAIVLDRVSPPKHPERAPQWLRRVLQRGLAHDPQSRWPSMHELLRACREPPRSWRRWQLGLGVAAIAASTAVGVSAAVTAQRERSCADAGAQIDELWHDETAAAVAEAFAATGIQHAHTSAGKLAARLDEFRDGWRDVTQRSCLALRVEHGIDEHTWSLRDACLQAHRERLAALVEVVLQPERTDVDYALEAAYDLPPPSECEHDDQLAARVEALGPDVTLADVGRLRAQLARAEQLARSGRAADGRALAAAAEEDALEIGDAALRAESLRIVAIADRNLGEYRGAAEEAEQAYFIAESLGAYDTALRAAIDLVNMHGARLNDFDEAMIWARHAEGLLERSGDDREWFAAELNERVAAALRGRGDFEHARAAYETAIAARTASSGAEHPLVARALLGIASMLAERADAGAEPLLDRAEAIYRSSYGSHSRVLNDVDGIRCTLAMTLGQYVEALPICARVLEGREAELGPDHPVVATALSNYANARVTSGDLDGARELLVRAADIRRRRLGAASPQTATTLNNLGVLDYHADDVDAAVTHLGEALEIRRKTLPPGHVDIATTLCNLADVHAYRRQFPRAIGLYEEAVQITTDEPLEARVHGRALAGRGKLRFVTGSRGAAIDDLEAALRTPLGEVGDPADRCEVRHTLAEALLPDPGAAARVRELARTAHAECLEAGERGAELLEQLALWSGDPNLAK